jgi:hypothetical protein
MKTSRARAGFIGFRAILGRSAGSPPFAHVRARRDHLLSASREYPVATDAALRRSRA